MRRSTTSKAGRLAESQRLMDLGYELLDRNNPQEALRVGRQLEQRRYSGGFEIQARALNALHRPVEAIATLERGVEEVPGNWSLWQFLGNCRSEAGHFDSAFAAYDRAMACDGDSASIGYNYAEALLRAGRWDDACARVQMLFEADVVRSADPLLGLYLVNIYEEILLHQGRDADAAAHVSEHADIIARAALRPRGTAS